jgi:EAL domain-containing protein (putative c-di-GMP-specific phosphodiesterase class I)
MEALVRWHHPERGLLPAAAFIPLAEKAGLTPTLGQWVIDRVCQQLRAWMDEGLTPVVAVNLSGIVRPG